MAAASPAGEPPTDGLVGTIGDAEGGTTGACAWGAELNVGRAPCSCRRPAPTTAPVIAIVATPAITTRRLAEAGPFLPRPGAPEGGRPPGGPVGGCGHEGGDAAGSRGGPGGSS